MRRPLRTLAAALACAALFAVPACKVNSEGEAGLLSFSYQDPDELFTESLESPLAVDTQVEVRIKGADNKDVDGILIAKTEDDAVARVVRFEGSTVLLEGRRPGTTTLVVETVGARDTVSITVAAVAQTTLKALTPAELALKGGTEPLAIRRIDSAGQDLVGEAAVAAVGIEPEDAATRLDGPAHRVLVRYGGADSVTVSVGDNGLTRTLVGVDRVARFELQTALTEGEVLDLNSPALVGWQAFDGADAAIAALNGVVTIEPGEGSVCQTEVGNVLGLEGMLVWSETAGPCDLTLTLGAHTHQISVQFDE